MSDFRPPYIQHRGLKSHPGNILALAVTDDGQILATGGSQGTHLWNIDKMTQLHCPCAAGSRGGTCTLLWVRRADEPGEILFSGTQNGYFFCWIQNSTGFEEVFCTQVVYPGEITGMAFDTTSNRLAICTRNDIVQSWTIARDPVTRKWTTTTVWSKKIQDYGPRGITFAAFDNSKDRDIVVFGFHNSGPITTLRGGTGEIAAEWSAGMRIGDAATNWGDGLFCLDDTSAGPTLIRISDQMKIRQFATMSQRKNEVRPRHVRFGEHGTVIVSGSDHGTVYVFDTRSGQTLQKLPVGSAEWVQTVATAEVRGVSVIFAAQTRAYDGPEEVFVWKRARSSGISWKEVSLVLQVLTICGCAAFVYQNLTALGVLTMRPM
ncbi:WD40-repeat-containing domain protein [Mycena olivaceomarginata]|nr:WD40-repeat-containing domain protein [Mycena olivaceomarginata]